VYPVSHLLISLFSSKSKSISKPNFVDIISIHSWDIITSGLEKQTSAILECHLRFLSRPLRHNWRVILHQAVEFRSNRTTHGGNMMSYRFYNMAAAAAQYYFRFRICWCQCLQKVKIYQQTRFRRNIPFTAEILLLPVWKTNVRHIGILLPVSISTISP